MLLVLLRLLLSLCFALSLLFQRPLVLILPKGCRPTDVIDYAAMCDGVMVIHRFVLQPVAGSISALLGVFHSLMTAS